MFVICHGVVIQFEGNQIKVGVPAVSVPAPPAAAARSPQPKPQRAWKAPEPSLN